MEDYQVRVTDSNRAAQVPVIEMELQRLEKIAAEMMGAVDALEMRLTNVLGEPPPSKVNAVDGTPVERAQARMTAMLRQTNGNFSLIVDRLTSIMRRLEL